MKASRESSTPVPKITPPLPCTQAKLPWSPSQVHSADRLVAACRPRPAASAALRCPHAVVYPGADGMRARSALSAEAGLRQWG